MTHPLPVLRVILPCVASEHYKVNHEAFGVLFYLLAQHCTMAMFGLLWSAPRRLLGLIKSTLACVTKPLMPTPVAMWGTKVARCADSLQPRSVTVP